MRKAGELRIRYLSRELRDFLCGKAREWSLEYGGKPSEVRALKRILREQMQRERGDVVRSDS